MRWHGPDLAPVVAPPPAAALVLTAELERCGVARSAMTVQAFGESRPLVPTEDGAREPQNRRVEIVLR